MTTTRDLVTKTADGEDVGETDNSRSEFEEEGQGKVTAHGMTTGDATTDGAMARTAALAGGMVYPSGVAGADMPKFPAGRADGTRLNQAHPAVEAAATAQFKAARR